ncbi:uncharacterized protein I206_101989 [Kwoniella pini CBS 10737]|uniref:Uncharacterized protein n=1 Tax=Kwoniella pini CBS 10737 TaxID=1296096 RepID=A0AAJ8L1Z7_9TREE
MTQWRDAPYLHFPNSTYLDSLSNNTDPYTIYYGQAAVVSSTQLTGYAILNIIGIISLSFLVGTILLSGCNLIPNFIRNRLPLSKETKSGKLRKNLIRRRIILGTKIQRDPCLINAFIVIILVNILNLLYWMANNGKISSEEIIYLPHPKLCRAQAILQAGSQSAQMSVVLSVVLRLWLKTITLTTPRFDRFRGRTTLLILLALPYLFVLGFVPRMVILTMDSKAPLLIPTPFYCSLLDLNIRKAYQILTGVIAIITLIMELWVIFLITKHFRQTSRTSNLANASMTSKHGIKINLTKPQRILKRSFYIRVSLFVFWTIGMIMATLYQAFDKTITDSNSDFVFGSMGLIAFICFASQSDILRSWNIPSNSEELIFFLNKHFKFILKKKNHKQNENYLPKNDNDIKRDNNIINNNNNNKRREILPTTSLPQSVINNQQQLEFNLYDFLGDSSPGRKEEEIEDEIEIQNFINTNTTTSRITGTSGSNISSSSKRPEIFSSQGDLKEEDEYYEEKLPIENFDISTSSNTTTTGLGFNMDLDPPSLFGSRGMIVTLQEGMSVEEDLNLVVSLNKNGTGENGGIGQRTMDTRDMV